MIAGFLAASGWLLMTGGVEVVTQSNLTLSPASWAMLYSPIYGPQILVGLAFAVAIVLIGRVVPDYLALPVAFIGFLVVVNVILFGFVQDETVRNAWFLPSLGQLTLWWPISAVMQHDVDWGVLARVSAEIGAVCGITAISMLLDVSSLEVARQKSADLDKEFRTNGFANILAAVVGGAGGNLSLNGALLIEKSGAVGRLGGVFAALVCAVVLFAGADIGSHGAEGDPDGDARLSRRDHPRRDAALAGAKLVGRVGAWPAPSCW